MSHRSKRDYRECSPSKVAKYRGLRKPRCNGGDGCNRCRAKYDSKEAKDARIEKHLDTIFGRP